MSNPVTPLSPAKESRTEVEAVTHGFFVRRLVALDVFINVVLLNGLLDETISAHMARAALAGRWYGIWACKVFNIVDKDHGAAAIVGDEARAEVIAAKEKSEGV